MMNTTVADQLVAGYLARLDAALRDLPAARREELLEQVREHIATARAELGDEAGEAEIRTLLDRLGDPATIAAEAGERPAEPAAARPGWREIGVLILSRSNLAVRATMSLLWATMAPLAFSIFASTSR